MHDVNELLRDAVRDAPVSRLRPSQLYAAGVRRRRVVRIGAALVTCVVAGLVSSAGWLVAHPHAAPPAIGSNTPATPTPTPSVTPRTFDPMRRSLAIDPPDGFRLDAYWTSTRFNHFGLESDNGPVAVWMYAAGQHPYYEKEPAVVDGPAWADSAVDWTPAGTPGPTVNGAHTLWQQPFTNEQASAMLSWEYAPDAWIFVQATSNLPDQAQAKARDTALLIAQRVSTNESVPLRSKFTVAAPPAPARMVAVLSGADGLVSGVLFSDRDDFQRPSTERALQLLVAISPMSAVSGPETNRTMDGHPAWVRAEGPEHGDLRMTTVEWRDMPGDRAVTCTAMDTRTGEWIGGVDGVTAMVRSVKLLDQPVPDPVRT